MNNIALSAIKTYLATALLHLENDESSKAYKCVSEALNALKELEVPSKEPK